MYVRKIRFASFAWRYLATLPLYIVQKKDATIPYVLIRYAALRFIKDSSYACAYAPGVS